MWCCYYCEHLNRNRKKTSSTAHYLLGCDARLPGKGYVCGWISKSENEKTRLMQMGCSDFKERQQAQVSLFD